MSWRHQFIFGVDIRGEPFSGSSGPTGCLTQNLCAFPPEHADGEPAERTVITHGHACCALEKILYSL
ncbi:hypothetical protein LDENG_00029600 [Lucifuga dentata]|nr:hypothetical protein LDENG_00029600 [Lucifuga dentata]